MRVWPASSLLLLSGIVAACSGGSGTSGPSALTIDGSTALQPLVAQAAADYMAKHPDVTITVTGGGSAKGLRDVYAHAVDIGDSDVAAAAPDLVDHQVAVAAFSIVHGPDTGVEALTKAQVASIFAGKTTNWKQLGGHDRPIVVFNRPRSSGTRRIFSTYFLGGREPSAQGTVLESSEQVAEKVKNTPGAISYVALGFATKYNVPSASIDGAAPSVANIRNRSYGFWGYEHMYTSPKSPPQAEAFIDAVSADDAVIDRLGFIAIKDVAVLRSASPPAQ